ncbi:hypothetical protein ACWGB8_22740 [Kitasatospora sp. NPDC054939]
MTDRGLTDEESLRALAALEAAWREDEEALAALAARRPEEQPLPLLLARYGEFTVTNILALAFGINGEMSAEEFDEASERLARNVVARICSVLSETQQAWAASAGDDVDAAREIARSVIDAILAVTEGGVDGSVLPLLGALRQHVLKRT